MVEPLPLNLSRFWSRLHIRMFFFSPVNRRGVSGENKTSAEQEAGVCTAERHEHWRVKGRS